MEIVHKPNHETVFINHETYLDIKPRNFYKGLWDFNVTDGLDRLIIAGLLTYHTDGKCAFQVVHGEKSPSRDLAKAVDGFKLLQRVVDTPVHQHEATPMFNQNHLLP